MTVFVIPHAADLSIRFLLRKIIRVSSPWGTWLRTCYCGIVREERKNPCTRQESNPRPQEFCSAAVCSTPVLQPLPFVPYHLMHNIVRTINFCPDSLKVTWEQTTRKREVFWVRLSPTFSAALSLLSDRYAQNIKLIFEPGTAQWEAQVPLCFAGKQQLDYCALLRMIAQYKLR